MKKQRGFTLIELLVVIAIIALLMSILMPALAKVNKQAKSIMCRSKLKNWGIAFQNYADDNKGYFPFPMYASICYPYSFCHSWWPVMRPYFKDYTMLYCPMATKTDAPQPYMAWSYGTIDISEKPYVKWPGQYTGSYGVNAWIFSFSAHSGDDHGDAMGSRFGSGGDTPEWRWKQMDNVKAPDTVPIFADCAGGGSRPRETDAAYEFQWMAGSTEATGFNMGLYCIDRHNCSINAAFADSSARSVGLKELWRLRWHRKFNTTAGPKDGSSYSGGACWPDYVRGCKSFVIKGL